jgi:hypothetical protein
VKPSRLEEGSAGRDPTLNHIPWDLPYKRGKITENPQLGELEGAPLISDERDCFVDLAIAGDELEWPAGPCRPWLSRQAIGVNIR